MTMIFFDLFQYFSFLRHKNCVWEKYSYLFYKSKNYYIDVLYKILIKAIRTSEKKESKNSEKFAFFEIIKKISSFFLVAQFLRIHCQANLHSTTFSILACTRYMLEKSANAVF